MCSSFPAIIDANGCSRPLDYFQIDPVNQVRSFCAGTILISDKKVKTPEKPRKEIADDYFNSAKNFPKDYNCIILDPTCGQSIWYPDYLGLGATTKTPTTEKRNDNNDTDSDISYDSDDSYDSDSSKSKRKRRNLKIQILKKLKSIEKKSAMYHEELKALLGLHKQKEENVQKADILQGLLNI